MVVAAPCPEQIFGRDTSIYIEVVSNDVKSGPSSLWAASFAASHCLGNAAHQRILNLILVLPFATWLQLPPWFRISRIVSIAILIRLLIKRLRHLRNSICKIIPPKLL